MLHASIIESTTGTAVVNDATSTYYNPAALVFLKKTQLVFLNSYSTFNSQFNGIAVQSSTGFTQSGSATTHKQFYLPSFYVGLPLTDKTTIGFSAVSNFFETDIGENSILRYAQSNNNIRNIEFVSALEHKLNSSISIGAELNIAYAYFLLNRIVGFPSLNIPDSQSHNESDGTGIGGDVGLLLRPNHSTIIGFNYRSAITYRLSGASVFANNPNVVSDNYGFTFWTPARVVLSINQALTQALGIIGTVQRIKWSIFNEINIHGIAALMGGKPVILNATVPLNLHDTWILTVGGHYQLNPNWIIRVAGNYTQSPGNNNFQITNGDSIILGISVSHKIAKNTVIDAGYGHAFILKENIHVSTGLNRINGVTQGFIDVFSLKITFNVS